ncbi:MAG: hypothetical protein LBU05_05835, partial [Bifidobacteriaceae bacterium]|nr:hypothetical protein [Bifidobacteriaceae bacterium]
MALTVAVCLGLNGCMKVTADYQVNADDTARAKMIIAYKDSDLETISQMSGTSVEDMKAELKASIESSFEEDADQNVKIEEYAADGYTGYLLTDAEPEPISRIAEDNDDTGELNLKHEKNQFILDGFIDLTGPEYDPAANGFVDPVMLSMAQSIELELSFTFPGKVKSSTGVIDGNKVTFTPKLGQSTEIKAVAADGIALSPVLLLAIAVGAIAVLAGLSILLLTLRKKRAAGAVGPDFGAGGPAGPSGLSFGPGGPAGQTGFGVPGAIGATGFAGAPGYSAAPAAGVYPAAPTGGGYPAAAVPPGIASAGAGSGAAYPAGPIAGGYPA